MKKKEIVKKKQDFNNMIASSQFFKNKYFVIYIRKKKEQNPCFGIAISKKVGNAVVRNKQKRRIRAIIDDIKVIFPKQQDYIIMIRKNCVDESFKILKEKLTELIKEIE